MTIGAEIRNENVTPMGTPAVTKPMKRGTAEQEQNGVTMPSKAAITFPADSRFPARMRRVRSGVKKVRMTPTKKNYQGKQHQHLRGVVEKKFQGIAKTAALSDTQNVIR